MVAAFGPGVAQADKQFQRTKHEGIPRGSNGGRHAAIINDDRPANGRSNGDPLPSQPCATLHHHLAGATGVTGAVGMTGATGVGKVVGLAGAMGVAGAVGMTGAVGAA